MYRLKVYVVYGKSDTITGPASSMMNNRAGDWSGLAQATLRLIFSL
jgi:hypothetical protein